MQPAEVAWRTGTRGGTHAALGPAQRTYRYGVLYVDSHEARVQVQDHDVARAHCSDAVTARRHLGLATREASHMLLGDRP